MIEVSRAPDTEWTRYYSNVYSQFGEDGLLAEIFRRIGTTNKQCFEVGAADGKWFSNSRRLIDEGWQACLIEAEPANWAQLDKLDNPPKVNVVHGKAEPSGPNSLDSILTQCGFEQSMDLGVIDVDGQDYYLWNGLLRFAPRVMVVEYDPHADPNFVPDLNGTGQAGLAAICSVAVSRGYFNAATTRTNAIFIRNDLREKFYATVVPLAPPPSTPASETMTAKPVESSTVPVLATGKEQEIKIVALLSRPRFGLNVFWDCASEALAPWHIPIRSFYGVFWGMCMQKGLEEALEEKIDWVLCLDYDTLFTAKHVQQLIDALGQNPQIDAIAALQCRRGRPLPLAVRADGAMPIHGGPVQVRTAHFGLTLLRCEALRKLKRPWFWSTPAKDGSWGEGRLDDDIYFWGNWGDSGNSLYVHTGCRIGHVEEMASQYETDGTVKHHYLSEWRKLNGHQIKSFE